MLYTVLDFETTGLDYLTEQVTEIGAIKIDEKGNEVARLHTMVQLTEGKKIPEKVTELTGIKKEDTYNGIPENTALNMLKDFIGSSVVVAQNAPFDLAFLAGSVEPELFICTRALATIDSPFESASLKYVTKRLGVELEGHHRAMNDVEATVQVFLILKDKLEKKGYPITNVVIKEAERPLRFTPLSAIVLDKDKVIEVVEAKEEAEKEGEE
ncbi:3'-5' exonuclease [Halobacillus karajensis]|uniref:3'-5' exonuclease n=1 Tax=Halobacillus karajensis TaxID=195088 RepID=UPI00045CCEEE|nr:3'-5' exonuclease [Halobacillus karajensis]CDQ21689.1 DNA polymerase III PolC-type [Halobacillus karajensis]